MANDTTIHEHKEFKNIDYTEKILRDREFIKCKFVACIFTKSDLRSNSFEDCIFEECNFSMTVIDDTGFRNATFNGCKIFGVDFTRCSKFMFSFKFENCSLDYCTFFGTKLKKTNFIKCSLKEVDFSSADLSAAVFTNSDFLGAKFSNTILEKADFRNATNFSIDPEFNKLKKAKFSPLQLEGLLYKYQLDIDYSI
jgi:fluoroquinolone resistance protein